MMAPRNFETNRANAQHSTGPTTPAGKQTVSQNALRHGLSGRVHAALPGERQSFDQYCQAVREDLAPAGVTEEDLVSDIAADRWRLKRGHAMENALFEQVEQERSGDLVPAVACAAAWVDPSKGLQRLALYIARIQRALHKNTAKLEAIQAARQAAHAQASAEAILLTELAVSKGETYDPAPDFPSTEYFGGFVYSAPEVARLIARSRRLEEAKTGAAAAACRAA